MIGINLESSELFKNNKKYKLSSIISGDNLLYSLSEISTGKILAVRELPDLPENFYFDDDYLKSLFEENGLFNNKIEEVSLAILSPDFSLVPEKLYKESIKLELFAGVSIRQYEKEYEIVKNHINELESYNLFLVPKQLKKFLDSHYKTVTYHHATDIFLSKYDFIDSYDNTLMVNLNDKYLQTAIFKGGNFTQTNVYSAKTKEDVLYYIVANLSNSAIPMNKANVVLSGRIEEDSSVYNLLYEHIKNISFVKGIPRLSFSNIFLGKSKHLFFDLYALSQCE